MVGQCACEAVQNLSSHTPRFSTRKMAVPIPDHCQGCPDRGKDAKLISIGVDGAHASLKHTDDIENMELEDASNLIELGDLSVKKAKQTIHIF